MTQKNELKSLVQQKLSRRGFLRGLSVLSVGTAAGAVLPTGVAAAAAAGTMAAGVAAQPQVDAAELARAAGLNFTPIAPNNQDDIVLPEGYEYQLIIKRGDVFTPDSRIFGDNADWTGWYPIDFLEGGNSVEEGLLVVNNEYFNPLFVSNYNGEGERTLEQVNMEKAAVGISTVHVRRENGQWTVVTDSELARRYDATDPIEFTGPVAGTDVVNGATEVIGTLGNCSGGQTPWGTALSCEENYQTYYGEDKNATESDAGWLEIGANDQGQIPEHYGWVVEVNPYDGSAKKRTAMGRVRHENVAVGMGNSGKVVAYMGDDKNDAVVYKFISEGTYDPENREANLDILENGTLYAANFGTGEWVPVVYEGNEELFSDPEATGGYTLDSLAAVLTYCHEAARALGGTPTDRPEDIEIHPENGDVYIAFTNNTAHGNFHGQITRIMETDGDHESLTFNWDVFAVGGPQSGFSSPDNMIFDNRNNLWVVTDVSSSRLNQGIYQFMGNNSLFVLPTSGEGYGRAFQFASGPVECEMTGPTWIGDDTLILAVQHPGEETESIDAPTSNWPTGEGVPYAGVVAVTGPFNATS